jgi:hypothetical protein
MLVNLDLVNRKVATHFGEIQFNENGESFDLTAEQEKEIAKAIGFKYVEDKKVEEAEEKKPARKKKAE